MKTTDFTNEMESHFKLLGEFKLNLVCYDKEFFNHSKIWLADEEIKRLTMTPNISEESREKWFDSLTERKDYYIRGILCDDKPIGAVGIKHINFVNQRGEYWGYIGVKQYWGKGIGKYMVSQMCETAKSMGLNKLDLQVAISNNVAYRLYKNQGFQLTGERNHVLIMEKVLQDPV